MITRFQLDNYNPLRGLDAGGVVSAIEIGERGYYARLQWLYRAVEKKNATARAVKRRLLSSLGSLEWSIKTADVGKDPTKKAMADRQAEKLRADYDAVGNLTDALEHLALAELRGFSHLEKVYRGAVITAGSPWDVVELRIVEQWFLCREGRYGAWCYNPEAQETNRGTPIDEKHWIVREVDDPANEIIAEMHIKQVVSDADWDGFLSDYGVPPLFVVGPPNVSPEKEKEYQALAEKAVSAARGYLPNGAALESPSASGSGGASIFKDRLDWLGGQIVIAGTSGKLTILSESGSGTLAGEAQKQAFDEVAQAIAAKIAGTMQDQFDKPILARAFPGEPVLAYFEYGRVDEEDEGKVIDNAVKLADAGFALDVQELSERSGFTLTQNSAPQAAAAASAQTSATHPVVPGSPPATDAVTKPPESPASPAALPGALATELRVTPEFLAPAQSALDALLAKAADGNVSDAELLASAQELLDQLPELAAKMDVTGIAAGLEAAMRTAAETAVQA